MAACPWISDNLRTGTPTVTAEPPRTIIIDTGPLIGVMYADDAYHEDASRGFGQLFTGHTQVILPVPILFEVYKRLAYDVGPALAHQAFEFMRASFTLWYIESDELARLHELILLMGWWGGSLEDAVLAMSGLARDVPVWTYNYRDLRAFPNLQFWTPA